MFSLFKSSPLNKLKKEYSQTLEQAMQAQRVKASHIWIPQSRQAKLSPNQQYGHFSTHHKTLVILTTK